MTNPSGTTESKKNIVEPRKVKKNKGSQIDTHPSPGLLFIGLHIKTELINC